MNSILAQTTAQLAVQTTAQALGNVPLWAWATLSAGVLFAVLAGIGALLAAKRARWIETLVGQRTAELAQINEKLAEEICDHLNTEHALDKERESLKAVLNNLHEGILVLDSNGQLRIANGAALNIYRQIVGIELERLDHLTPFDFYGSQNRDTPNRETPNRDIQGRSSTDGRTSNGAQWPHVRALSGETVRDHELTVQGLDGSATDLSINAQPLFTSDGRQHGAVMVVRDITDGKKVERLKSEFVATVSHELRTPITSIRGSLGLIAAGASGPLGEKTRGLVDIALRNSERLAHLINDLLDIEKIESGKMRFELEYHSLAQIIQQAIEANNSYAENFNVKLAFRAPVVDATVCVDPYRLLQVLANLISNAAKFSPRDSTVNIEATTADGGVRVEVHDRGPGIAAEFHSRIFQKFSQADGSDTRNKSGTGLGLAICKAIVEQMNGRIGFETEMGKGTTFYFELPIATEDKATGEPQQASG